MNKYRDGNTGNEQFVFIKDGVIKTHLSLEPEYGSTQLEYHHCIVSSTLIDMAQRFYDELNLLKDENTGQAHFTTYNSLSIHSISSAHCPAAISLLIRFKE